MNYKSFIKTFFLLIIFNTTVRANIIYVSENGNDLNGSSWETAYTNLSSAIENSIDGNEIWVRDDFFNLTGGRIIVDKEIDIIGGFIGNESNISQKPVDNKTSIHGAFNAGVCFEFKAKVLLEGFNFFGFVNTTAFNEDEGMIKVDANSILDISNCSFYSNQVLLFNLIDSSKVEFQNSLVYSNNKEIPRDIFVLGNAQLLIDSSEIYGNGNNFGSQIIYNHSNREESVYGYIKVKNSKIHNNEMSIVYNTALDFSLENCEVTVNQNSGYTFYFYNLKEAIIVNSTFGGMFSTNLFHINQVDSVLFDYCVFEFPSSTAGSAIYSTETPVSIRNSIFSGFHNSAVPFYIFVTTGNIILDNVTVEKCQFNSSIYLFAKELLIKDCDFSLINVKDLFYIQANIVELENTYFSKVSSDIFNIIYLWGPDCLMSLKGCVFENVALLGGNLIYLSSSEEKLLMEDCSFESVYSTSNIESVSRPFFYIGSGEVSMINNQFKNLTFPYKSFIYNYSNNGVFLKGNLFEEVSVDSVLIENDGNLILFNNNINISQPALYNKLSAFQNATLDVINTVIYTDSSVVYESNIVNDLSINFVNCYSNQAINQDGFTQSVFSYESLYLDEFSELYNAGISVDSLMTNFIVDVDGVDRVQDRSIDIGAYERMCDDCIVGLTGGFQENNVEYFPNPVKNKLNFLLEGELTVVLYDCMGVKVLESIEIGTVSVEGLSKGVYVGYVYAEGEKHLLRIIKD